MNKYKTFLRNDIPKKHKVLGSLIYPPYQKEASEIFLGMGCFWGAEKLFWDFDGIISTSVGYGEGETVEPTYQEVCSGKTNHIELVKLVFQDDQNTLKKILKVFWESHDPTQGNRQGNDIGYHYRSIILFNNTKEEEIINKYIVEANQELYENKIVTEVKEFTSFYKAEQYHQGYYKLNSNQPYCNAVITPKILKARKKLSKYY